MIRGELVETGQEEQGVKKGFVLDDNDVYVVRAFQYHDGTIEITVKDRQNEVVDRGQTRYDLDMHRHGINAGVVQTGEDAHLPEDGRDVELLYRHARQYPDAELPVRSQRDSLVQHEDRDIVADVDRFYEEHAKFYGD